MEKKRSHKFPSERFDFGVEFTAYEGEILKEGALTSFTLYDSHHSFAPGAQ